MVRRDASTSEIAPECRNLFFLRQIIYGGVNRLGLPKAVHKRGSAGILRHLLADVPKNPSAESPTKNRKKLTKLTCIPNRKGPTEVTKKLKHNLQNQ